MRCALVDTIARWEPTPMLRKELFKRGWKDQCLEMPATLIGNLEAAGFEVHQRALQVLPRLNGQSLQLKNGVLSFDIQEAMSWVDDWFAVSIHRLAGGRCCIAGSDTWMHYLLLEDDRWLVLHGGWANCFTLPSTEVMLSWCFAANWWTDPRAPVERFTPARLRELGVPEDP